MSRTLSRILMFAVVCAIALALFGLTRAMAAGSNPMAWMAVDSGPGVSQNAQSGPDSSGLPNAAPAAPVAPAAPAAPAASASPATSPAQDADGDGDGSTTADNNGQDSDPNDAQGQELSGVVASIDSANSAFTLTTANGPITVSVTNTTQYDDGLSALSSLQQGMNVSVEGAASSSGQVQATDVKGPDATDSTDAPDNGQ